TNAPSCESVTSQPARGSLAPIAYRRGGSKPRGTGARTISTSPAPHSAASVLASRRTAPDGGQRTDSASLGVRPCAAPASGPRSSSLTTLPSTVGSPTPGVVATQWTYPGVTSHVSR